MFDVIATAYERNSLIVTTTVVDVYDDEDGKEGDVQATLAVEE